MQCTPAGMRHIVDRQAEVGVTRFFHIQHVCQHIHQIEQRPPPNHNQVVLELAQHGLVVPQQVQHRKLVVRPLQHRKLVVQPLQHKVVAALEPVYHIS